MCKISILIVSVLITTASCYDAPLQEFVKGNEKFIVDVVQAMARHNHETCVVSPLSMQIVLALLAEGATGETYNEIQRVLHFQDKQRTSIAVKDLLSSLTEPHEDFNLTIAGKLYIGNKFPIKKAFKDIGASNYQSEVENINFAELDRSVELINDWIASKTNDKIQDLVRADQLITGTTLVMVNALYMDAKWEVPFLLPLTEKFNFLRKGLGDVEMLHSPKDAEYLYHYCDVVKAKFLEIPYRDSTVSATFVLPDAVDGLTEVDKNVEMYLKRRNMTLGKVAVSLPKFSVTTEHDFREVLTEMGVSKLFAVTAELTGITDGKSLSVDFIRQKTFLSITETGTEAATATAAEFIPHTIPSPPDFTFRADHPFFFYIRESKSEAILLMGCFQ